MTEEPMVERVARAIYEASTPAGSRWELVDPHYQETVWRSGARAALTSANVEGLTVENAALRELQHQQIGELTDLYGQVHSLRKNVEGLVEALRDIENPIRVLQRRADAEGSRLNSMAYSIASDPAFIKRIAADALAAHTKDNSNDR